MNDHPTRRLPAVHTLLDHPSLRTAIAERGREPVLAAARASLDGARSGLLAGGIVPTDADSLAADIVDRLRHDGPRLRPVINATGVLLHTGLGRAPLAEEAVEAVRQVAAGYCNLEFDLDSGGRGSRTSAVAEWLRRLTGAEAVAVTNNNAAATVLALRALARDREILVSRGELVEIGGGFRLPEVFETSGARLREVGTTNKTRLADYERAIGPDTAAILRVHASNFRIVGFTERAPLAQLVDLARRANLVLIDDIGSGALAPGLPPGPGDEPTIAESLAAGADLVLCSGDKLLGGPQCGLMLGSRAVVGKIAADPLMRACRVDKMTLAALETTLRLALDPARARRRIPLWSSLTLDEETQRHRSEALAERLRSQLGLRADVEPTSAFLGGGSHPAEAIPSFAIRLRPPFPAACPSETVLACRLRAGIVPVIARLHQGCLLIDLKAVGDADDARIYEAIRLALEVTTFV